jgi:cholesterol transport system auxiliary component
MKRRTVLVALALAGCGLSERPYVERRDWPLTVSRPDPLPPRAGGRVLLVRSVQAGPGMDARGLQTLRPDGSLDIAFYDEWGALPAEAVEQDLRAWLAQSGLFSAVTAAGSQVTTDLVLESRLTALIADPQAHEAKATLSILLVHEELLTTPVLLQATITGRAPLPGNADARAKVEAMKAAVADMLGKVEQDLGPFAAPAPEAVTRRSSHRARRR